MQMPELISIVIPARNESKNIPMCLEAIRQAEEQVEIPLEIVVVINRCTDNTEEVAKEAGCIVVYNETKNLASIRNTGVRASTGDLVITIDADSIMSKNMLNKIVTTMSIDRHIGGGVAMYPERLSLGIFLTYLALVPVALFNRIAAGVFFFFRADFDAIGGFNEALHSAEDIDFARRLKAHGKTCKKRFKILVTAWIVTSCRKFDHFGDWYFLKNPRLFCRLLKGTDQKGADRVWYDW